MAVLERDDALRVLGDVPEGKAFWLCDNTNIKSVPELYERLKDMPKEVFESHVNNEKNDFAAWINDVQQDEKLAKELMNAKKERAQFRKIFRKRISWLKKKARV